MPDHKDMPPIPRDHDQASFSELMPIRSSKINLKRSPLLLFVIVTAVTVLVSFGALQQIIAGASLQETEHRS